MNEAAVLYKAKSRGMPDIAVPVEEEMDDLEEKELYLLTKD